eukprot:TRINITY_DN12971_c0_g1_i1.p1 TRINITY_DN12971_c0_g1~~TRINITY_DN12971_c0_g1_i1.p1  ORF type:complete len:458 (+),score=72.22 TRINITY_DN12971_c0_g1_i1:205-1374(+)
MKYAWVTDNLKEEREQAVTGTVRGHTWKLGLAGFKVVLTDTPGRRKYFKNIISGMQNRDLAIVVVSAVAGDFERELGSKGGFLRELILMLYSTGVKQLIVAVTKMDDKCVAFSWDRFNEIQRGFLEYSTKVGFTAQSTTFVPVSGWTGDNVNQRSARMPWYDGPTITTALNNAEHPHRLGSRPLRLPIQISHIINDSCVVVGQVESGNVVVGDLVSFVIPSSKHNRYLKEQQYRVSSIETHHTAVSEGKSGDLLGVCVTPAITEKIPRGAVMIPAGKGYQAPEAVSVQLLILKTPGAEPIRAGYQPILSIHSAHIRCTIEDITAIFDRDTASIIETAPTSLKAGDSAIAKLRINTPTLIEPFYECPSTGRFLLRDRNEIIAVGIVRSVA